MLSSMYSPSLVKNNVIIPVENKYFVFPQSDAQKLTEQHYDVMGAIAADTSIHNPVFTTIDEEGRLVVIG